MRILGFLFLGLLAISVVIGASIALDLGGLFYREKTADIRGRSNAEHSIESSSSRIARYEKFFNLCAGIQAKEASIDTLRADDSMDAQQRGTAVTSNQIARNELIAEYNSKAAQAYTAARFRASSLPATIARAQYDGSNPTTCRVHAADTNPATQPGMGAQ